MLSSLRHPGHPSARFGSVQSVTLLAIAGMAVVALSAMATGWLSGESEPTSIADDASPSPDSQPALHAVTIRKPSGPPRVDLGVVDEHGFPVHASCSTCHATRTPNQLNRVSEDLNEFHGGLVFTHTGVSCLSCHNPNDYDTLRLADGTPVSFTDVMTLCAQCHGPQTRDYLHGAHGGMTGYWDLTRGPRTRNNCVDCHDSHAPQFPRMLPTFKPKDRFLSPAKGLEGSQPHG